MSPDRAGAAILAASIVLAAGCGSSGTVETAAHGTVTAGPTCPVEGEGQPCPPDPVTGATVAAIDPSGHAVRSATTDPAGRYSMSLAPGSYTLRVATDGPFPACPDAQVRVTAGTPVTADILCDTGIR